MNNKEITILYRTLSIIFGLTSLIARIRLLYVFFNWYLNK